MGTFLIAIITLYIPNDLGYGSLTPLSTIFQLYVAVSFIGGGNQTCHKSLTNLSHNGVSSTPRPSVI
jgi:hypothetical protein